MPSTIKVPIAVLRCLRLAEQARQQVRALLQAASSAHREFELRELNGVRDEAWPAWYANYLITHGLQNLIGREVGAEELAKLLSTCDDLNRANHVQEPWPDYYAKLILEGGV